MVQDHGEQTVVSPGNPADAFAAFAELIRKSHPNLDNVTTDEIFRLLRPFIVNPQRNEAAVREIVRASAVAAMAKQFETALKATRLVPFLGRRLKGTIEQSNPNFIRRLRDLEAMLKTDLRPGSIKVSLKPIQYLDTPKGFGPTKLNRYRFVVQTIIDPTPDDILDAVSVQFTASALGAELVIDAISPQPGFSAVGLRSSSGAQIGVQESHSEKETIGATISGVGGKLSSGVESERSAQTSESVTVGSERSLARVEQYLMSRKAGNRALWRVVAGIGPVDAAGTEYVSDVLIPDSVRQVSIHVEAKVEWVHCGVVPAEMEQLLTLPSPLPE
jgi:hypothetical protein